MKCLQPLASFLLAVLFLTVFNFNIGYAQPIENKPSGFIGWNGKEQGQYVTALCADSSGNLWVGTEDKGLYRRGTDGKWRHFSTEDGLGDNTIFCLCVDSKNRLWAGTARGGVSVFNGISWRTFGVLDGPLSERVRDIVVSPLNGDVWLGTEAGLCRYSDETGWRYSTRLNGLQSDQIVGLSFDAQGNLFVATACDGLAIGRPADDYGSWESVYGLDIQPTKPQGESIPSNQLNDVCVASDGTVWAATNYGIAKSSDHGKKWFFLRGKDWRKNVEGSRWNETGAIPPATETGAELLEEDWISKIEATPDGNIWIGYRRNGFELRDGTAGDLIYTWRDARGDTAVQGDAVVCLLPIEKGAVVGNYGSGIQLAASAGRDIPSFQVKDEAIDQAVLAPLPNAASPFSAQQLDELKIKIASLPVDERINAGFYGTDWRTRGNWVGRYGDANARLYAIDSPSSHDFVRFPMLGYEIGWETMGFHRKGGGPYYTNREDNNNLGTLYSPLNGKRRPGEINDAGWQGNLYPPSWDGPDLWVTVQVPAGTQRVALYFHNIAGHDGTDRFRDYTVHLKAFEEDLKTADIMPDLATGRVKDFWGGGYLQFWVQGPGKYRLKIASGNSHVTILQGAFLDQIHGPTPPEAGKPMPGMGGVRYVTEETPPPVNGESEVLTAARALWNGVAENSSKPKVVDVAWVARLQAYRAAVAANGPEALLANWRWKLGIWNENDEAGFQSTMATAFAKFKQEQATAKPEAAQ